MDINQQAIAWSSALPAREGFYLGSEGQAHQLLRLGAIKSRIGQTSDIKQAKYYFWLTSNKLPNRLHHRWIIMLVEPCLIDPLKIKDPGVTILCLSQLTYLRFSSNYNLGKVVYVTDPLLDISPVEAQKINSLVWGNELLKPGFLPQTIHYDAIISALQSNQPLVTWINPQLYLKDTLINQYSFLNKQKKIEHVLFVWNKIPTTVIVLERDQRRVFHVKDKLIPKIPHLQWFSAIDGNQKPKLLEYVKHYQIKVKNGLRTGQIGCALSHFKVWSDFLESKKEPFMVVLEDDSYLKSDYDNDLQAILKELPFYFDWVYLYVFPKHYRDDEAVQIKGMKTLNKAYYTYCTVGYLISRQGAKKLTNRLKNLDQPLDEIINQEIKNHKLIAFSSKKILVKNLGQQTSIADKHSDLPSNVWGTRYYVEPSKIEL